MFFEDLKAEAAIEEIEFRNESIAIKLYSEVLGRGLVTYYFTEAQYNIINGEDFEEILKESLSSPELNGVALNRVSNVYHLPNSNHLPGANFSFLASSIDWSLSISIHLPGTAVLFCVPFRYKVTVVIDEDFH